MNFKLVSFLHILPYNINLKLLSDYLNVGLCDHNPPTLRYRQTDMSDDVLRAVKMTFVHDIKQSRGLSAIANFLLAMHSKWVKYRTIIINNRLV